MRLQEGVLILFRNIPWRITRELPFLLVVENHGPGRRSLNC